MFGAKCDHNCKDDISERKAVYLKNNCIYGDL